MNVQLESFFNLNSAGAIAAPATTFIYGLNDPVTGKCRYVGKADNPARRFNEHLIRAGKSSAHKDRWICGLAAQGLKPVLEVLDEVPALEWELWEREYIRVFRTIGFNLTNLTDGGDGCAVNLGKKFSLETRAKMSTARRGKTSSEETRAKMSASHIGKPLSEQHRRKAKLGYKKAIARRTLAGLRKIPWNKGKTLSPEYRAKISEAAKVAWKAGKFSARRSGGTCG